MEDTDHQSNNEPVRHPPPAGRYQKLRTLRKTLFGKVKLYMDNVLKQRVAIKFSDKRLLSSHTTTSGNTVAENPLEELRFLRCMKAAPLPNGALQYVSAGQRYVLQLLDEYEDADNVLTVLEFCGKGEFFDIVCNEQRFTEQKARKYFKQMCLGVEFIHSRHICHLDLSLENLLMTDQDELRICDFGVARFAEIEEQLQDGTVVYKRYPGVQKNKPGKLGYMAPGNTYHRNAL